MKERRKVQLLMNEGRPIIARKTNRSRNEKCACGSDKKVKRCCGVQTEYFTDKKKMSKKEANTKKFPEAIV